MIRDEIERLIIESQTDQKWLIVEWEDDSFFGASFPQIVRYNFFPVTRVMKGIDYIWGIEFNNGMVRIPIDKIVDMYIK